MPKVDETYGKVMIDGITLDPAMVRLFMAQSVLPSLKDRVVAMTCTSCGKGILSEGDLAFTPTKTHRCGRCENRVEVNSEDASIRNRSSEQHGCCPIESPELEYRRWLSELRDRREHELLHWVEVASPIGDCAELHGHAFSLRVDVEEVSRGCFGFRIGTEP